MRLAEYRPFLSSINCGIKRRRRVKTRLPAQLTADEVQSCDPASLFAEAITEGTLEISKARKALYLSLGMSWISRVGCYST
jgi:hypothetical protein